MNECYTTVCLVLRSWNPVCLTNDFPGNLLMQKVLLCLAKKIGKGGGIENVKEVLIFHFNNRGWYSLKEKIAKSGCPPQKGQWKKSQWCYFGFRTSRFWILNWFGFYMRREVLYSYFHLHYFSCSKFLVYLEANEEELAECIFWEERN